MPLPSVKQIAESLAHHSDLWRSGGFTIDGCDFNLAEHGLLIFEGRTGDGVPYNVTVHIDAPEYE